MGKINFLITSAGRRVRLVENFKSLNVGEVFTCDMNPKLSSACVVSDGCFEVPRVTDESYIPVLLEICKKNDVKIIVPTIDTELVILAENKDFFKKEGVLVVVSDKDFCKKCYLKTSTYNLFSDLGFKSPRIIKNIKDAKYPLFAKLNNSSLSIGAKRVSSYQEAFLLLKENRNYIFQEFIEGREFTVDVFIDSKKNVICIVPRERLEVRCGEVSKARTLKDRLIINEVKSLCEKLEGAYGVLTIQLFKKENEIVFIEINPRFGGGYPLTWQSGADFAKFILDDYLGKDLNYFEEWKDNLIMLRYDAEVLVDGSGI